MPDLLRLKETTASNKSLYSDGDELEERGSIGARPMYEYLFLPSVNKPALKVFESVTLIREEMMRQLKLGYFIIHPCSRFKLFWNIIIAITIALNMVIMPIALSFFYREHTRFWIVFNLTSSVIFAADIFINFFSGVIEGESARLDRAFVVKRYLLSWFIIDFLGTIPFDLFLGSCDLGQGLTDTPGLCGLGRVLGFFKLLRIPCLAQLIGEWQALYMKSTHRIYLKIINVVISILLMCHFNGCLLFFVPMVQGFPETSWVVTSGIMDLPWHQQYLWCLFSAWSIMVAISFVKAEVETTDEVVLCFFVLASGAIGYGVLLANGTALVQIMDYSRNAHEQTMTEVREFIQYKKLPNDLKKRMCDYYENRYRGLCFDQEKILAGMSDVLRERVLQFGCRSLIATVPFFKNADPRFIADVVKRLRSEFFQPGDYIIREGTHGTKMYFIERGNVNVILGDGKHVAHLRDGAYFGEMGLLLREARSASILAETYCDLYSLDRNDFMEVLERYPRLREEVHLEVSKRQRANSQAFQPLSDQKILTEKPMLSVLSIGELSDINRIHL